MAVYKNHAVTTVQYKRDYAIITFWKCKYDEEQTIKEFNKFYDAELDGYKFVSLVINTIIFPTNLALREQRPDD